MVAAVLVAGSEKAAAHRLGLSHSTVKHHLANARARVGATTTAQLVWVLAPRLPEPEGVALLDEWRCARLAVCSTGVRSALTAYDMPVEGRDEWLAAPRRLAQMSRNTPSAINQTDQTRYAIGTMIPARCHPSRSFGPTNSNVPTRSAIPILPPVHRLLGITHR